MEQHINITTASVSSIDAVDFDHLAFGATFTDHMFVCDFKDGKWEVPEIVPYAPMQISPAASVLHYGQAVFEGMKAFKDSNGGVWLFRPEENAKRINKSAERLAIPTFPEELFLEGMKKLISLDKEWIKAGAGKSLYVRPFVFASEAGVQASAASEYRFMIICAPVASYYGGDVRVKIADHYSRAPQGGVGYAKAAGNYGGQFYPTQLAKAEGYQQVIWTDAATHEHIEEAGTMNLFFRIGDTLITAPPRLILLPRISSLQTEPCVASAMPLWPTAGARSCPTSARTRTRRHGLRRGRASITFSVLKCALT